MGMENNGRETDTTATWYLSSVDSEQCNMKNEEAELATTATSAGSSDDIFLARRNGSYGFSPRKFSYPNSLTLPVLEDCNDDVVFESRLRNNKKPFSKGADGQSE